MSSPRRVDAPTPTTSGARSIAAFRRRVRESADDLSRELPWIGHDDPWGTLVAEVMLQQTPTTRVIGPWGSFLAAFPTPRSCAEAPLADVLRAWSGLGYPRRARSLQLAARVIVNEHAGVVPSEPGRLRELPGVGPYTANAVASFSFGRPVGVLDTNVGRVLARAVAGRRLGVREAQALADDLVDRTDSARFNQAMLDLGAQFCRATPRCHDCPVRTRCRWRRDGGDDPSQLSGGVSRPQARFEGSLRQARGRLVSALARSPLRVGEAIAATGLDDSTRAREVINSLVDDGLVERTRSSLRLVGD